MKQQICHALKRDRQLSFDEEEAKLKKLWRMTAQQRQGFKFFKSGTSTNQSGINLPMSPQRLSNVAETYNDLYDEKQPKLEMFDLSASKVQHFEVMDGQLTSEEIRAAAKKLKSGKAPGMNKLHQDMVKQWSNAVEGSEDAGKFDKVATKCKEIFTTGNIPKVFKEGILVLLPKDGTNSFRGITLLDSVYKLIVLVINAWAMKGISFHKGIHRFRVARGCNMAIQDAKWDMMACQESGQTYHQVFLDLSKAFDTVDRTCLFMIMRAYGFGERTMIFLQTAGWTTLSPHVQGDVWTQSQCQSRSLTGRRHLPTTLQSCGQCNTTECGPHCSTHGHIHKESFLCRQWLLRGQ